jgi:m7GpppX diphosphatase
MATDSKPATDAKTAAESLIPQFQFQRLLNQDQNGRRISLLGSIHNEPALITLERAAFPTDPTVIETFLSSISNTTNLGSNDIYRWYMASHSASPKNARDSLTGSDKGPPPDLKLNLIYPCTSAHIKKYSPQRVRMVTETPAIYAQHVHAHMRRKREEGRLNWVFNILEGRTEQEDVIMRELSGMYRFEGGGAFEGDKGDEGFVLLPDLNWDRETMGGLHLLALVERRDFWSLRDLKKKHVLWLRHVRERILAATVCIYKERGVEADMLKLYVHCKSCLGYHHHSYYCPPTPPLAHLLRLRQVPFSFLRPGLILFSILISLTWRGDVTDQPTYYHFHIHIVNVMLEAGTTQATGKAFGLENIISQLEAMEGGDDAGMADVSLTYFLGEASELWEAVFEPLKEGREPGALEV